MNFYQIRKAPSVRSSGKHMCSTKQPSCKFSTHGYADISYQRKNTRQCTRHLCLVFSNISVFSNTRYKQFSINFSIKFNFSFLYLILVHGKKIICLIFQRKIIFEKIHRNKSCRYSKVTHIFTLNVFSKINPLITTNVNVGFPF